MKKILFLFAILSLNSVKCADEAKPQLKESENVIASAHARRYNQIVTEAKALQAKRDNAIGYFAAFQECNARYQADYIVGKKPKYNCFLEFINKTGEAQVAGWFVYYWDNYYNPQLKRALKKEALAEMQK